MYDELSEYTGMGKEYLIIYYHPMYCLPALLKRVAPPLVLAISRGCISADLTQLVASCKLARGVD